MKIIKKGKINNIVTCDFCECEYEFDINDIKKESCISYSNITLISNTNTHEYKYVECPCCGHKHYLQKPTVSTIEVYDKITGSIDDTLTTITKVEGNNGK